VTASLLAGTATGDGSDTLTGFEKLVGSRFNDTLTGDSFANSIIGGDGNDKGFGRNGDDFLDGGAGTDSMTGGLGTDTCYAETVHCEITAVASASAAAPSGSAMPEAMPPMDPETRSAIGSASVSPQFAFTLAFYPQNQVCVNTPNDHFLAIAAPTYYLQSDFTGTSLRWYFQVWRYNGNGWDKLTDQTFSKLDVGTDIGYASLFATLIQNGAGREWQSVSNPNIRTTGNIFNLGLTRGYYYAVTMQAGESGGQPVALHSDHYTFNATNTTYSYSAPTYYCYLS
jgi:hypothetical protein